MARRRIWKTRYLVYAAIGAAAVLLLIALFALPRIISALNTYRPAGPAIAAFPVTVDPARKQIIEDPEVEAKFFDDATSTELSRGPGWLARIAALLDTFPIYARLASADSRAVIIDPGFRKEQVAHAFGKALGWDAAQEAQFLAIAAAAKPQLSEGEFEPGLYVVGAGTTPGEIQARIYEQFDTDILSRYTPETADVVPLSQALTIASMIERETSDPDELRMVSGIIWNRLITGMRLQIDATVQYAIADKSPTTWWPVVKPRDLTVKSPYNTYLHAGLPPAPIATPSVAAVLAALNPKKTDCLFYFHDDDGGFHCSATYAEHVALLKQYFGRGK